MMEWDEFTKKYGKCCITDKPLSNSTYLNMVQLNYLAAWKFPVWGNVISVEKNMAVAFVHDDCFENEYVGEVKYAVEYREDPQRLIYHPVDSLVKMEELNS
jgi:hypothetical protein